MLVKWKKLYYHEIKVHFPAKAFAGHAALHKTGVVYGYGGGVVTVGEQFKFQNFRDHMVCYSNSKL